MSAPLKDRIREQYQQQRKAQGNQPVNLDRLRSKLQKELPNRSGEINDILLELRDQICLDASRGFPQNEHGYFLDRNAVAKKLRVEMGFGLPPEQAVRIAQELEDKNVAAKQGSPSLDSWIHQQYLAIGFPNGSWIGLANFKKILIQLRPKDEAQIRAAANKLRGREPDQISQASFAFTHTSTLPSLDAWVHQQFSCLAFENGVFVGWLRFTQKLVELKPDRQEDIKTTVMRLREPGSTFSLDISEATAKFLSSEKMINDHVQPGPVSDGASVARKSSESKVPVFQTALTESLPRPFFPPTTSSTVTSHTNGISNAIAMTTDSSNRQGNAMPAAEPTIWELLERKLGIAPSNEASEDIYKNKSDTGSTDVHTPTDTYPSSGTSLEGPSAPPVRISDPASGPDEDRMNLLLADNTGDSDTEEETQNGSDDLRHAPILSGDVLLGEHKALLPQYGLLGTHERSKLFVNTNVPFSAFICGVQGSGKSHTTSCLMENALIPSSQLGRLANPLSALVFSYSPFSGDGADFNISEAAYLGAAHPDFPSHPHVRKITVLVSPSNPKIAMLYRKVPNVTVLPFMIKPRNLDIETMLTLMSVSDTGEMPLYMAEVTKILRELAAAGGSGLNYALFKQKLRECKFNPKQTAMLKLRLDLLESFLDLHNSYPEPLYRPGEITIMDMSCPFVDPNTACILFKIGLQRYLHSDTPGKMVVLDEAHKYMLKVPGAKALNDRLHTIIRMQHHYGARVIVSTQEPTLLTNLIALCSITVVHRFSSPEWFSALSKHIPMAGFERGELLEKIEALRTGTALVYSSNAVLGKNEDGGLIKGVGKMLKVSIRKRVTADGGMSVLAV